MAARAFYIECNHPDSTKDYDEADTFEEAMEWFQQRLKPGSGASGRLTDRTARLTGEQKIVLDRFNISFR